MHRLSSSFILGYHGCDRAVGERILSGASLKPSRNKYDWLGPGIYFWEANPQRGLEFARETSGRKPLKIKDPFVIGAIIDLGLCLDLTTSGGIEWVKSAHGSLVALTQTAEMPLPQNKGDGLRRNLDCAVRLCGDRASPSCSAQPGTAFDRHRKRCFYRRPAHLSNIRF